MQLALGVDSSTQSTKVEARDLATGTVIATGSAPHPPTTPPLSEQDPASWWSALSIAIEQLGQHRRDVVAVSVAGQQHGMVLLDGDGESLTPAQLWNDTRGAANAEAMVDGLGATAWAQACGSVPLASFTVAKLAWMQEHKPAILSRVRKIMLPHDYLTWRLSGEHVTDRGDASGTGWFNPSDGMYRPDLLANAVDDADTLSLCLPQVVDHRTPAGTLSAEAASALGLPAGIPIGAGTGDNMAGALGLGLRPGDVAMSLGTSGTVYSIATSPTADPSGLVAGFADATGAYLPLVCTLNATKVTDTVASWLGTDAAGLSDLAIEAGTDFDGTVLVPYFDGERTPSRPDATGTFTGLRTSTSREMLARAAHDGVLCGLLDGLDALRAAGVASDGTMHLIGGGARSAAYRQRCADLLGTSIVVPDTDETVATGAAVLAARLIDGLWDAPPDWGLGQGDTVEPRTIDIASVRDAYAEARG